jgi:cobalamin biosynthetic protein CobC
MLEHGGHLLRFAQQYQIPVAQWLDLSTGVSPFTYPCSPIPTAVWNRLPELNDGLEQAAATYYGCNTLLAVAGSQAAIMALPQAVTASRGQTGLVALPRVGYKEHQHAWQSYRNTEQTDNDTNRDTNRELWEIEYYEDIPSSSLLDRADVVLFINPNNPAAVKVPVAQLQQWQVQLQQHQGLLIVDEAFIDCTPEDSLLNHPLADNVMVLRSIGKFFGLAGARVGFIFGQALWLDAIAEKLGPWTISGPSRWITREALLDSTWQQQMRQQLAQDSARLRTLLQNTFFNGKGCFTSNISGTELFKTVALTDAPLLHQQLCQQAVLTRLCDERDALRFGLPGSELQWRQLEIALAKVTQLPAIDSKMDSKVHSTVDSVLNSDMTAKSEGVTSE